MKNIIGIALFLLVLCSFSLAQSMDQNAFITVTAEATVYISFTIEGKEYNEEQKEKMSCLPATIVSNDGTAIAALSIVDLKKDFMDHIDDIESSFPQYVQSLNLNIKMDKLSYVLADGSEVPVQIAYSDERNDIAVLKPLNKDKNDYPYIDVTKNYTPKLFDELYFPVRTIAELGSPVVMVNDRIIGTATKPYTHYIVGREAMLLLNGATCFTKDGQFIGMLIDFKYDTKKNGNHFVFIDADVVTLVIPASNIITALNNAK